VPFERVAAADGPRSWRFRGRTRCSSGLAPTLCRRVKTAERTGRRGNAVVATACSGRSAARLRGSSRTPLRPHRRRRASLSAGKLLRGAVQPRRLATRSTAFRSAGRSRARGRRAGRPRRRPHRRPRGSCPRPALVSAARAALTASRIPSASWNVSIASRWRTLWANPRSICERITPAVPARSEQRTRRRRPQRRRRAACRGLCATSRSADLAVNTCSTPCHRRDGEHV